MRVQSADMSAAFSDYRKAVADEKLASWSPKTPLSCVRRNGFMNWRAGLWFRTKRALPNGDHKSNQLSELRLGDPAVPSSSPSVAAIS